MKGEGQPYADSESVRHQNCPPLMMATQFWLQGDIAVAINGHVYNH
jgi:hypothetical protein